MTHDDPTAALERDLAAQDRVIADCFAALRAADADLVLELDVDALASLPTPNRPCVPAFALRA